VERNLQVQRVKDFLVEKESARQSSISSTLKINQAKLNGILGDLEREGFIEKKKVIHKGHQINTVALVKSELDPAVYRRISDQVIVEDIPAKYNINGLAMFDSPCFFCSKLETCGEDMHLNYYNCPKLNDWISKPS
jgi:hypothetical protein